MYILFRKYTKSAGGGIRTHEAYAVDLKSTPFDRSGTPAIHFIYYIIALFLSDLYQYIYIYILRCGFRVYDLVYVWSRV